MAVKDKDNTTTLVGFSYLFSTSTDEDKPLKVSIIISIVIHLILLWIVIPQPKEETEVKNIRSRIVYLRPFKKYTPAKPPKKGSLKAKKRTKNIIPIPDPTPDDPEPETKALTELPPWVIESDDATGYEPGVPDGVPEGNGIGPIYKPSEDVTPPTIIKRVKPIYPKEANEAKITGRVILEAIIDAKGRAQRVRVIYLSKKGFGFDKAVLEAFKEWCFQPGTKDGKPVAVYMHYIVDFYQQ